MADLVITTEEEVILSVSGQAPSGGATINIPPDPVPTWTTGDATKVALRAVPGDPTKIVAVGVGVASSTTITATSGSINDTFTIQTKAPDDTTLTIVNETPRKRNDLSRSRGRGLGLGYE